MTYERSKVLNAPDFLKSATHRQHSEVFASTLDSALAKPDLDSLTVFLRETIATFGIHCPEKLFGLGPAGPKPAKSLHSRFSLPPEEGSRAPYVQSRLILTLFEDGNLSIKFQEQDPRQTVAMEEVEIFGDFNPDAPDAKIYASERSFDPINKWSNPQVFMQDIKDPDKLYEVITTTFHNHMLSLAKY